MIKFLLNPDLNSAELMAAGTLVRVTAEGIETDDPAVISVLDAFHGVYRDGVEVPAAVETEHVPGAKRGGKP